MGLRILDVRRAEFQATKQTSSKAFLCGLVRQRNTIGFPIGIGPLATNDSSNLIPIADSIIQALEHYHAHTFTTPVSVSTDVKRK